MKFNVYVANLGKYNEGILQGKWFSLPVDPEEVAVAIGLDEQYEEYAIHDYEAPFRISEYTGLDELNELAEAFANVTPLEVQALTAIKEYGCIAELDPSALQDVLWFHNCYNMKEVAEQYVDETELLDGTPEHLQRYFDYEAYGRDLEIEGTFIYLGQGVYIQYIG